MKREYQKLEIDWKVGKALGFKEDYLFWATIRELSGRYDYRMITVTENHQEIWLESDTNKEFPVIRLIRQDLDWANWLKRDIERTLQNGERIRQKLYKKPINILSIYVSKFAPVDDHDFSLQVASYKKTKVNTFILTCEAIEQSLQNLEHILKKPLSIQVLQEDEIDEEKVLALKKDAISESVKKAKAEQKVFQHANKPFFTYLFMAIQIAVFILMEFNGGSTNSKTLIEFGAKYSPLIMQGEWWRFFSPIIVHIGFFHLLMNTFSLYLIGAEVERIYGNARFLFIYAFAGFAGTLGSFIMTPNLSAGASGAIFGCFGALLYFGSVYPKLFMRSMGSSVIVLIIINLIYGFSVSGIDNAGHIGGLIGGFLAAGVVSLPKNKNILRQLVFFIGTAILTYTLLKFGFNHQNSAAINDNTMAMLAQKYINDEKEAKAEEMLTDYVGDNPDAPLSLFMLGNIAFDEKDSNKAKDYYEKAIDTNPDLHQAHYNLALVQMDLGSLDQAKEQAEKAIELAPDNKSYAELLKKIETQL
ncbi:rhomboid family intramembrane serine protease [Peribacillus muralis]|uniref:rhomboid family intramembrane serine protease n=1 Tax=Peribacillus muralis TaxID=264697 RepID=UPI001F4D8D32|nr:rhomboid family intramembrane serine protease [Peribacillus muralis]MCK2012062.1 rhomboid family intramembrane serine protease [Peribacillus muralis]